MSQVHAIYDDASRKLCGASTETSGGEWLMPLLNMYLRHT